MENNEPAKKAGIGERIVVVSLAVVLLGARPLISAGVAATVYTFIRYVYLSLTSRPADALPVVLSLLSILVGVIALLLLVTPRLARPSAAAVKANTENGKLCSVGDVVRAVTSIVLIVCQLAILVWAVLSAF